MNARKALIFWTGVMLLAVFVFCSRSTFSHGQEAERLKDVRKEIRNKEKTIRKIKIQERSILEELEKLDKGISFQNQRLNKARDEIHEIQKEREVLTNEIKTIEAWSNEQRKFFHERLVALYKMDRFGLLPVLFSTDPFPTRLRNMNFMRILMQNHLEKIQEYSEHLREKIGKEESLASNMAQEKSWEEKVKKRLETLSTQRQKKTQWLFRVENERALYERLLSELETSSRQLEKLLLEKEKNKNKGEEKLIASLIPGGAFKKQKGLLPWPIEGKVLRQFGKQQDPRYNTTVVNDGIDIKAVPDQEIRAIFGGAVIYSGWFRGYGQLLIIDHGDDYCSVIAHADRLTKKDGEKVEMGEILGYAGETGSLIGPAIHFEIRYKGQPLDPLAWIRTR